MTIADERKKSKEPYSRTNPFPAKLVSLSKLSRRGSTKEVLHAVLDLENSDLDYLPGDSFGIYPQNCPRYVNDILEILDEKDDAPITDTKTDETYTLREFLSKKACLSKVTKKLLTLLYEVNPDRALDAILQDKSMLMTFIEKNNVLTTLESFYAKGVQVDKLCSCLCSLLPRYYSVASSKTHVGNQVELMIASFSYMEAGKLKHSVTAKYLLDLANEEESTVDLFLQRNQKFRLPEDPSTPIILIGPGTGLAALRGFLQERIAANCEGDNWLFTGDREREFDFHYEEDLLQWERAGKLHLDLAFSRDGEVKVYVQNRMEEKASKLWHWIHKRNASIYICGDAKRMAKDVQACLLQIVIEHGNMSEEEGKAFIKELKKSGRLLTDIY